jgi:hypothetical protein
MGHPVLEHVPQTAKVAGEALSLSFIGGVFLEWLPPIAAGVAIVWHMLLIYDWTCKKIQERRKFGRREEDNKKKE